jgi:hypothetical protein
MDILLAGPESRCRNNFTLIFCLHSHLSYGVEGLIQFIYWLHHQVLPITHRTQVPEWGDSTPMRYDIYSAHWKQNVLDRKGYYQAVRYYASTCFIICQNLEFSIRKKNAFITVKFCSNDYTTFINEGLLKVYNNCKSAPFWKIQNII